MKLQHKLMTGVAGLVLGASTFTACTDKVSFGNAFLEKASGSSVTIDTVFNKGIYRTVFEFNLCLAVLWFAI